MNSNESIINVRGSGSYYTLENVKAWLKSLLKLWWLLAIIGLAGGVAGFWTAYKERPKYESHLTFSLEDNSSGMGGALSLAAEFGFSIGATKSIFDGDNILSVLTSRSIIRRALLSVDTVNGKAITMADYFMKISADSTRKKSADKPSPSELRLQNISFPAGQPRSSFSYLQDSVLMNLYKSISNGILKVRKPDKKINLYEVSVTTYDERFSKIFTDRLMNEATAFYVEIKTKKSKETLDLLEQRVAQTKGSLRTAIQSKAVIQDANVNPVFQQAQAVLQEKQVDISAYGGAYGELYKNMEMARYQYLRDIPLLQIIDAADYPMNRIKRGKLRTAILFALVGGFVAVLGITLVHIIKSEVKAKRDLPASVSAG